MRFIQISTAKNGSAGGRARPATIFGRSFMTHCDKNVQRHTTSHNPPPENVLQDHLFYLQEAHLGRVRHAHRASPRGRAR